MKRYLVISTAVAALMASAAPSFAQDTTSNMFVVRSGEDMSVMTEGSTEGRPVLRGENFAAPADCPEGSYYMSGENMITACGEAGAAFEFAAPGEGQMMTSGQAFPEGAMVMRPRESGEQKSSGATGGDTNPDSASDDSGGDAEGGGDVSGGGGGGGDGQNDDSGGDAEGGGDVGGGGGGNNGGGGGGG